MTSEEPTNDRPLSDRALLQRFAASRLARGAGELWERGTRAAFLDAVGEGTLPREAFERWLVEDYRFVVGFTRFACLTAAKLGRPGQSLILGGLAALDDELGWFEAHAARRGLELEGAPHPVCRRYVDFMLSAAHTRPVEVLLSIFYGIEVAYTVAWGRLRPAGGSEALADHPYGEFIDRWTSPAFQAYVAELEELADAHPHPGQQAAFDEVMRHEHDFWRMTWEG